MRQILLDPLTWSYVVTALFLLSELLAQIPAVKANSVFQAVANILNFIINLVMPNRLTSIVSEVKTVEKIVSNKVSPNVTEVKTTAVVTTDQPILKVVPEQNMDKPKN